MSKLTTSLTFASSVLSTAADASGLPGAGVVSAVVGEIQKACEQIAVQKEICKRISDIATELDDVFEAQSKQLDGTGLLPAVGEVQDTVISVRDQVIKWADYGMLHAYMRSSKIEAGLKQCEQRMKLCLDTFHIVAVTNSAVSSKELHQKIEANHQEYMSVLLNVQNEIEQVKSMSMNGQKELVKPILDHGHQGLRDMRSAVVSGQEPSVMGRKTTRAEFNATYLKLQENLSLLHRETRIPPEISQLDGEVVVEGDRPFHGNQYSNLWEGKWLEHTKVAVKSLRTFSTMSKNFDRGFKRFQNELQVQAKLNHPNIHPILGVITERQGLVEVVSRWEENGDLLRYCQKNPNADRWHLLIGAAKGLEYLHSVHIVHGNMKCSNVLVTDKLEAAITDLAMAKVVGGVGSDQYAVTFTLEPATRWLAPEWTDRDYVPTYNADVYSFGMTMYECLALHRPFDEFRRDTMVPALVREKQRPKRPDNPWVTNSLWELIEDCWRHEPEDRPSMTQVRRRLEEFWERKGSL